MVASEFLTKKLGVLLMIFAASFVASAQAFHVVDEEGQRMAKFECMVNTSDQGCSGWKAGEGGVVDVFTFPGAKVIDVLVRADGYASAIKRFSGEELAAFSSPETEMTLKRGEPVELRLETAEGVELPDDLRPDVYFAEIEWRASMMRQPMNRTRYAKDAPELDFNMLVKPTGKGKFELRLAKDTPPFYVAIHQDGFLRFFEGGPFTMADVRDGALAIHVPKAAKLDVKLDMSAAKEGDLPKGARFDVLYKRPGNSGGYLFAAQEKRESVKDASLSIADLVPGEYRYTVITDVEQMSQPIRRGDVHPGPFRDVGVVKIGDGETKVVDVKYVPLDMDVTKGNRTAIVHILKPNKEPAAGKKAIIYYVDEHYGELAVFNGEVPANGAITLENITLGKKTSLGISGYGVMIDGQPLGQFVFADDEKQKEVSFRLPVSVGDEAPDVEIADVNSGKRTRLSEFRGKVVWLEFWATWCGPCQPAMAELVKTYGEQREEWADKIAVVPISVDDTADVVVQHTKDRGWDVFTHYWSDRVEDRSNFGSSAAGQFGVNGVPTAFLIGTDGKILWTGHPASATGNGKSLAEFIKSHSEE